MDTFLIDYLDKFRKPVDHGLFVLEMLKYLLFDYWGSFIEYNAYQIPVLYLQQRFCDSLKQELLYANRQCQRVEYKPSIHPHLSIHQDQAKIIHKDVPDANIILFLRSACRR